MCWIARNNQAEITIIVFNLLTFDRDRNRVANLMVFVATLHSALVPSLVGVPIHPVNMESPVLRVHYLPLANGQAITFCKVD